MIVRKPFLSEAAYYKKHDYPKEALSMRKAITKSTKGELNIRADVVTRAYGQLVAPAAGGEAKAKSEKAQGCFFGAGGPAAKVLEAVEEALHPVASPLGHPLH